MKRIIAIVGDFYHPVEPIQRSLETALQKQLDERSVEIEYLSEDQLQAAMESKPDAVVFFKEDRLNPQDEVVHRWMNEETEAAIVQYVEQGGAWLGWHSGLASYSPDGAYVGMLRGYFEYHPEKHSLVSYTELLGGKPADQAAFAIMDEHYFVHCDRSRTDVFLLSASKDGESIAGWRHEAGEGRVVCFTPAHTEEGLLDAGLLQVLASCVDWCLSK
ncbi:ThuA domain-containing protein [Paenibacillus hexagrammi]|uniref:ThuA domain-containing protein n=1 Tax=Paenibacillus hexagrammi TaxID=2908839 RepID=A0ABY3SF16_9BACL|nr:ThuA domain-containing protein [Paenibacillus sp. YPD9-1]UJF32584.1 ThuA domain-containing protein [Paenibacillus sp. YPD9-1]